MVAKIMVENSGVENFGVQNFGVQNFGVQNFGIEMSCNHLKSDLPHDYVLGKPGVGSTAGATT